EAETLGEIRTGSGGVEDELIAHRAAEELVHRLPPQLPEKIPQRKIDAGDGVDDQTLATIELAGEIHLVPDLLDGRRVAAFQETGQMPFDDERGGFSSGRDSKTDRPVRGLDLHHEGAEHVDAKAAPALAVLRVAAHRGGDVI